MGQHRSVEQRLAHAEKMVERNRKSAQRHGRLAQKCEARGLTDSAMTARAAQQRAVRLLQKWTKTVGRLETILDTRARLNRRAPHRPDIGPDPLTAAGEKARERELKAERLRQAQRKKRLSAAAVEWDPRTAQGRRPLDLVALGPSLRASVAHVNACLKKKADRTDARILAWAKLDAHFDWVHAGLLPAPRYEPGVDTSTIPGVSASRLEAAQADEQLRAHLGTDFHALLFEVIYMQRSFRDLHGLAYLGERGVGILFRRALDLAADWFDVGTERGRARQILTYHAPVDLES